MYAIKTQLKKNLGCKMVLFKNVPYLFLCSIHLYHQPFSLLQTKVLHKYIAYIMIIWMFRLPYRVYHF